jgi:hypothetical protein
MRAVSSQIHRYTDTQIHRYTDKEAVIRHHKAYFWKSDRETVCPKSSCCVACIPLDSPSPPRALEADIERYIGCAVPQWILLTRSAVAIAATADRVKATSDFGLRYSVQKQAQLAELLEKLAALAGELKVGDPAQETVRGTPQNVPRSSCLLQSGSLQAQKSWQTWRGKTDRGKKPDMKQMTDWGKTNIFILFGGAKKPVLRDYSGVEFLLCIFWGFEAAGVLVLTAQNPSQNVRMRCSPRCSANSASIPDTPDQGERHSCV